MNFSLCPIVNSSEVANCESWSLSFSVSEKQNNDNDDDENVKDDDSGFEFGHSIFSQNETAEGRLVLNEERTASSPWILFLLLLLLCVLVLFFIVLVLLMRDREHN